MNKERAGPVTVPPFFMQFLFFGRFAYLDALNKRYG